MVQRRNTEQNVISTWGGEEIRNTVLWVWEDVATVVRKGVEFDMENEQE